MIFKLYNRVINGHRLTKSEILYLLSIKDEDVFDLMYYSNKIKNKFMGRTVRFCSIINAKSGNCSENCAFCAQSSKSKAKIKKYPLVAFKEIKKSATEAQKNSAHLGIVTSGCKLTEKDFNKVINYIKKLSKIYRIDASLGELSLEKAKALKKAGCIAYNHNLETSKNYFNHIVTTHRYEDRVKTIKNIKKAKMKACCGGIFGMGEKNNDRADLAVALRDLDVDIVPLNFLNPIKGTPLEAAKKLSVIEILKIIAVFRFVLPEKDIKVCGGREVNLGEFQPLLYIAGANGVIIGNYLTTLGRPPKEDVQMVKELGLKLKI